MEQLNIISTKEHDNVYKILGDLMNANKEFQIMITVPSSTGQGERADKGNAQEKQPVIVHDLEKDVTDMIHEIGVPAHIKGYQYLREAIIMAVEEPVMISSITRHARKNTAIMIDRTTRSVCILRNSLLPELQNTCPDPTAH